jgi:VanZ family protein
LVYYVLPTLLWMGLIYALSAQPSLLEAPEPLLDLLLKKGAHMAGYAVLMVLWWRVVINLTHTCGARVGGPPANARDAGSALADSPPTGLASTGHWGQLVALVVAWTVTVLYAISDEVHQTFVPGRSGRALDVLIDACGALLVGVVLWTVRRPR